MNVVYIYIYCFKNYVITVFQIYVLSGLRFYEIAHLIDILVQSVKLEILADIIYFLCCFETEANYRHCTYNFQILKDTIAYEGIIYLKTFNKTPSVICNGKN